MTGIFQTVTLKLAAAGNTEPIAAPTAASEHPSEIKAVLNTPARRTLRERSVLSIIRWTKP